MEVFGYDIKRKKEALQPVKSVFRDAIIDNDDVNITSNSPDSSILSEYGSRGLPSLDFNNSDDAKIAFYRKISNNVHVSMAITELKNEAFIFNSMDRKAFSIEFYEDSKTPKNIQKKITDEAENLYRIINFKDHASSWFESWYVDSRFALHTIVDEDKPQKGILGVVQLDPVKVRKVKILPKVNSNGSVDIKNVKEAYVYRNHFDSKSLDQTMYLDSNSSMLQDVIMSKDSVVYIKSGLRDRGTNKTIGHLEKAIIPYNNLKMLEESMIIFRVVRAPQRRIFYMDVSNLQPKKAEKYLEDTRNRFKVNINFNRETGAVRGDRHIQSILEDYYIPRQGNRTTEVQTLDGQMNQDILDEVEYAREQLWLGLNVPRSRFTDDTGSIFSRPSEIQRDEYRLNLFLNKCREQFIKFFDEILKRQLMLKGIIKEYEWNEINASYYYKFTEDNLFVEYKNYEKLNNQLEILGNIREYIGEYFSTDWVKRNILHQSDELIENMQAEMKKESDENSDDDEDNNNIEDNENDSSRQ